MRIGPARAGDYYQSSLTLRLGRRPTLVETTDPREERDDLPATHLHPPASRPRRRAGAVRGRHGGDRHRRHRGRPDAAAEAAREAVHDALTAPPPEGVSARVHFTDNLIGESVLEGSDPLLGGASGRLWASADGRLRLELQADVSKSSAGDFQLLVDDKQLHGLRPRHGNRLPGHAAAARTRRRQTKPARTNRPRSPRFGKGSKKRWSTSTLSGAIPSDVAGQPAYTVHVSPQANGGLVGGAELAWDAANGAPLRAALYAKGESSPVLELSATEVSFGPIPESVFEVTPPPGAKVVELSPPAGGEGEASGDPAAGHRAGSRAGEDLLPGQRPAEPCRHVPRPGAPGLQRQRRRRPAHLRQGARRHRRARAAGRRSGAAKAAKPAACSCRASRSKARARRKSWKRRSAR